VDSGAFFDLSDPYTFEWDIEDGELHVVQFRLVTEDCGSEIFSFYIQSDPADCAIRTAVSSVINVTDQARVVLANISENDVILDTIDIRWLGQSGMGWQNVRFPSGEFFPATTTGSQTTASPRTVTFTPTSESDRLIKKGETLTVVMNFTSGTISPSTIGGVSADYHEDTVTTQFGCGTQLVSCAVGATTSAITGGTQINVDIKNNSTEAMTVTGLRITWTGQSDYDWTSTTAGNTYANSPPLGADTKSYVVTGVTIGAGDTYRATMNMTPTKANPKDLLPANVTVVWVEYTTPTSAQGRLTCRAK
jgi:hypothetical protein